MKHNFLIPTSIAALALLAACSNGNNEFPDFDYQTVYFANQYGMRVLELGEDEFVDLTADNNHEANIVAAWGGGYTNKKNVVIDYVVDPALVDGFYFKDTDQLVEVMPEDYYTIESNQIRIPSGSIKGGVKVHFTEKFFADPKSVGNCYVIPVRMTDVAGADKIITGTATEENPVLTNDAHWSVQPKNFMLYGVKYVNPWHGQYLRRGVDNAIIDGASSKLVRHAEYVENDEVVDLSTSAYKEDILPVTVKDAQGGDHTYNLLLTFADDNSCTLSSASDGATVTGTGKFVSKGEKKSLGGKDRDAIYLDYTLDIPAQNMKFESKDTLVLRTRNVYGAYAFGIERK
ncbi:MAG: DUF1735 domain-containing protein [Muribaculaceae bacterium]|nr:DUF1735 domain-containing protein [Muribaculaceae bacterium]